MEFHHASTGPLGTGMASVIFIAKRQPPSRRFSTKECIIRDNA
jgi:hypothetical protein